MPFFNAPIGEEAGIALESEKVEAKEAVRALLERLPDDCTLEDVQYHLYVLLASLRGQADSAAGRTIPHEQVARELREKWLTGSGK